jgi:putative ABC transport system permease protein
VTALNRKLLRDLWSLKAQAASIALVVACGIGGFVASFATYESLLESREHYYEVARFPHVFAEVRRAPRSVAPQIAAIDGVAEVHTRVVREVQLDVPEVPQPMIARMIGEDFAGPQAMNRLTLRSGR